MIHSGHMFHLDDLAETVSRTVADLAPHAAAFDSIAVSGVSGLAVGAPVALALGKPLVIVRKPGDEPSCWHSQQVEGFGGIGSRYLALDDSVSTGATLAHIAREIAVRAAQEHVPAPARAGVYLYGPATLTLDRRE